MAHGNVSALENMPFELLLPIFHLLNITELFVLGEANKHLLEGARASSQMEFGNKCVYLSQFNSRNNSLLDCSIRSIRLSGLTYIIRFLRLFGDRVRILVVDFEDSTEEQVLTFFTYLNRYCHNLEELALINLEFSVGRALKKPFSNLKVLTFKKCKISSRLNNFVKWFPNIEYLYLFEKNAIENMSLILIPYKCLINAVISNLTMDETSLNALQVLNRSLFVKTLYEYDYETHSGPCTPGRPCTSPLGKNVWSF